MTDRVGVVGSGLMGSGIAQVSAVAGFDVVVQDLSAERIDGGLRGIAKRLDRQVEKGELSAADRGWALRRVTGTTELEDLADCDLVIEAVVEDLATKNRIWTALDGLCGSDAIFASNTSSLSITEMAAAMGRPGRLLGLHFFNPVPVMRLVEVVRTIATEDAAIEAGKTFVRALGKEPVECQDRSGFVVNRLLVPYLMDAIRAVEEGVATVADVDTAMHLGAGHPMGPLTLCDFVGLDTLARAAEAMFAEHREPRYAPPPLLRRMVALGYFGRKSGRGFYDYSVEPPEVANW